MILAPVYAPDLAVVFCGTAAGTVSARRHAYYAGPGNRFWDILYETGLTPARLQPEDYAAVTRYGIGLTNIAPEAVGMDKTLRRADFDPGRLRADLERYAPRILAFNGKRGAQAFVGRAAPLPYGWLDETAGATRIYVLPSTSGAAVRYWDATWWYALAAAVRQQPEGG